MTSRRDVLQLGVSATAAAVLPPGVLAAVRSSPEAIPVINVVHDSRFRQSLALAQRLLSAGPAVARRQPEAIGANVAPFWYHRLSGAWKKTTPPGLAGVTGERVLFCLQELARDRQMRVVWRQAHDDVIVDRETGQQERLVSWLIR